MITKKIGLHVEDFLEKINVANDDSSIMSPIFSIGSVGGICLELSWIDLEDINLWAIKVPETKPLSLQFMVVTGVCGNLTIQDQNDANIVHIESIARLKKAMTTSGNHNLDLQVTLTFELEVKTEDSQWIIPR